MAKYNRNILVPYLQDVCSAELLCSNLSREIDQCNSNISWYVSSLKQEVTVPKKPLPSDYEIENGGIVTYCVIAFVCFMLGFFGFLWWGGTVIFAICAFTEYIKEEASKNKMYKEAMQQYSLMAQRKVDLTVNKAKWRSSLQNERNYLPVLKRRLEMAKSLRADLYSVDIIPAKYRNIYVAYDLYSYFDSSREDDLDKIIQTILLDGIIQRLDKMIAQNEEMLLNQRIQVALQENNNHMLAEQHREQMQHIARMEQNQELQLDYQHMIAKNQMLTNFILTADYLYK